MRQSQRIRTHDEVLAAVGMRRSYVGMRRSYELDEPPPPSAAPINPAKRPKLKLQPVTAIATSSTECVVCSEFVGKGERFVATPCFHLFHEDCLVTWHSTGDGLWSGCPTCRGALPVA